MNPEQLRNLYAQSIKSNDPHENAINTVISVIDEMIEQGFDYATLEELKQRIV